MKKLLAILAVCSVFLVGCLGGVQDEKQAFIDATVEATCLVFQAENIFDPALEEQAKEIYRKHGFDADDEAAMTILTETYQDDADVQAAITQALEECAGDLMEGFGDLAEDLEEVAEDLEVVVEDLGEDLEVVIEDVVVEGEAVVEEVVE